MILYVPPSLWISVRYAVMLMVIPQRAREKERKWRREREREETCLEKRGTEMPVIVLRGRQSLRGLWVQRIPFHKKKRDNFTATAKKVDTWSVTNQLVTNSFFRIISFYLERKTLPEKFSSIPAIVCFWKTHYLLIVTNSENETKNLFRLSGATGVNWVNSIHVYRT